MLLSFLARITLEKEVMISVSFIWLNKGDTERVNNIHITFLPFQYDQTLEN